MDSTSDLWPAMARRNEPTFFDDFNMGGTGDMDDADMTGTNSYFNAAMAAGTPGSFIPDINFGSSPCPPTPAKLPALNAKSTGVPNAPELSNSPESSHDTGSDFSARRKGKAASKSPTMFAPGPEFAKTSMIATSDVAGEDAHMFMENDYDRLLRNNDRNVPAEFDNVVIDSDEAMQDHFDFDSAASSPSATLFGAGPPPGVPKPVNMPFRHSPNPVLGVVRNPLSRSSTGTFDKSSKSFGAQSDGTQPSSETSPASSTEEYHDGLMMNGSKNTAHGMLLGRSQGIYPPAISIPNTPPPSMFPRLQLSPSYGKFHEQQTRTLYIHDMPAKSRVETQINVKLTLFPMPEGVRSLHLPQYTISKPKFLSKPPPAKSPDMLELSTTVVCTSAMQDPRLLERAMKRAASQSGEIQGQLGLRRSSAGDDGANLDDENSPLKGGDVQICHGCISRERKRAARKKIKKPEEEEPWQKDEAKRIIVLNTTEVRDWEAPSPMPEIKNESGASLPKVAEPVFPDNAQQVDLPIRIACYCRHQNEKLGFQVIFTIKDHQGELVAQNITKPIMITDDHKAHLPPQTSMFPGGMFFDTPNMLANGPSGYPGLHRGSRSTTSLPVMNRTFASPVVHQIPGLHSSTSHISTNALGTNVSRTLSRQVSPSASVNGVNKRRKGSGGSVRVPPALQMTSRQEISASHPQQLPIELWRGTSAAASACEALGLSTTHNPTPNQSPLYNNNSPENFMRTPSRNHSSDDLHSMAPGLISDSVGPSRAPSPGQATMRNAFLARSGVQPPVSTSSSAMSPQQSRLIYKIIPGESTLSGGIDVSIIGRGFDRNTEVIFGETHATTTTFWNDSLIVCTVPPAECAGPVCVRMRTHGQAENSGQVVQRRNNFVYIDDQEDDLVRKAFAILAGALSEGSYTVPELARRILQNSNDVQARFNGSGGGPVDQDMHQTSDLNSYLSNGLDTETTVLNLLEVADPKKELHPGRLNHRSTNGQTILHLAASLGYTRLVWGLLARGANPDARDRNGFSPLHVAALRGYPDIVRRLRLAGGDPTLRSLRGYTPADVACTEEVLAAVEAMSHSRSRSLGARSLTLTSRASSAISLASFGNSRPATPSREYEDSESDDSDEDLLEMSSRISRGTPQQRARSRRNSAAAANSLAMPRLEGDSNSIIPAAALTVWRDQLAAQIQQFQRSVNWTLPNLQIPALPTMPNIPGYQAHPMVRRFSSMVPQRRSNSPSGGSGDGKEADAGWWDMLSGAYSSPPAYEEIYPTKTETQEDVDVKVESTARAAQDAAADLKCAVQYGEISGESSSSVIRPVKIGKLLTEQEHKELMAAHAEKMRKLKLKSDRKLYFIWIPLLVFVIVAVMINQVPSLMRNFKMALDYVGTRAEATNGPELLVQT